MNDSNDWELSKENVQPLRNGRTMTSLTSALQHTPTDWQQIKDQRDIFERQIRRHDGEDPLDIWHTYIKWTEQHFPSGGKDGNLMELLQRCLTHFNNHEGYKNDPRFIQIWIKFANFIDDPLEIYSYMFNQNIGCGLTLLYEEWANFLERLGNTKKADAIYLEGIGRNAQPLDLLKMRHREFQMRVARGITLQQAAGEDESQLEEEQRTILGRLKSDKKNRVGTKRTGTAKLGHMQPMGSSFVPPQQQTRFHVYQDENSPATSLPQQTGDCRSVPVREQINRENEQAPGVWTKAKAPQKKVVVAASVSLQPAFKIHEDENARVQQHASGQVVDSHVLSARKEEKSGHVLDSIRNVAPANERPMYCKEKVYCGMQEFSLEELRALRYIEKKKEQLKEEEKRKLAEQLREMRLLRDQFQKDIENLRAEQEQLARKRQLRMTTNVSLFESPDVQSSALSGNSSGSCHPNQDSSVCTPALPSASSLASFKASISSTPSSAGFCAPPLAMTSSLSATNSRLYNQKAQSTSAVENVSCNRTQSTPVPNISKPVITSSGNDSGGHYRLHQSNSAGPTPDNNTSKHSLTSASPTINMKEALQMVQGMYNTTLDCDKINSWTREDTEVTEVVQAPAVPIVIFDETQKKAGPTAAIPIFHDENSSNQENKMSGSGRQLNHGPKELTASAGRPVQKEKPVMILQTAPEIGLYDDLIGEATEGHQYYDVTLAAVGTQDSFAAAARAASTPFDCNRKDAPRLPSLPLSSIKPHKGVTMEISDEEMTEAVSGHAGHSDGQHLHLAEFHTFNSIRGTPSKKDLSPIIEGSSEGSSEESKSHAVSTLGTSHHAATTLSVKTPVVSAHQQQLMTTDVEMNYRYPESEPMDQHVIDVSHYVPSESDRQTKDVLSTSVCIDDSNPFDENVIKNFLAQVSPPLEKREGYVVCNQHVPNFAGCQFVNLGLDTYQLCRLIGEGGYAKVYHAHSFSINLDDSMDTMDIDPTSCGDCVIKVQKPSAPWEFYICSEVHHRLQKLGLAHMDQCLMTISQGYFYLDGSCLISDFCSHGSLLTLVNHIKNHRDLMASLEPVAVFLTIHLLKMVETLHRCHIIHGDIKPDNILITGFPELVNKRDRSAVFGAKSHCLRLVDFGQAIDMSLYPPGTTFMTKLGTSGFQCIEMMTDQPWNYQTDMFGLAGSVHVLVFGQYMKVYCSQGQWHMTSSFQRKWKVDLWKKLFHHLLNIADCDHQPNLAALRQEFEDHFMTNLASSFHQVLDRVVAKVHVDTIC